MPHFTPFLCEFQEFSLLFALKVRDTAAKGKIQRDLISFCIFKGV